ncbi:MAG TPA: YIP1 family protein [Terriglobales bacterium]|nr:YIP1 family protein [Terriglobales bacterium]
MAAAPVLPSPTPEAAPLSEMARIVDVFIAPSKIFTDLRRNASWWAPFLLLCLMSEVFVYTVDQKIGFRKVAENQIQASPKAAERIEQLPAPQREQAMQRQTTFFRNFSYSYPVVILIWNVLVAAILFATFKFAASAEIKFKTALAVVMYASLPLLVKTILATISVAVGASADSFTFQNPVATNPGYFLNPADSHFLYSFATAMDIFMFWTLVVTAIGFSCVSKVKRSTALAIVIGWYLVFALTSAGLGSLFS